jgi:hypothetical protein
VVLKGEKLALETFVNAGVLFFEDREAGLFGIRY